MRETTTKKENGLCVFWVQLLVRGLGFMSLASLAV
jgi:hypothetical protein